MLLNGSHLVFLWDLGQTIRFIQIKTLRSNAPTLRITNEITFTSPVIDSKRAFIPKEILWIPKTAGSSSFSLLLSFFSFSHSFAPDTIRWVRSGCFSPRYSAIPPPAIPPRPDPSPCPASSRIEGEMGGGRRSLCAKNLRWQPTGLNPASNIPNALF